MEPFYPLHVWVCTKCLLVQLDEYVSPEHIFTEYAYFSSFSTAWLKHAEDYVAMISDRLKLGPKSLVIELASNDGYLLQYFVKRGIPSLGIEPAANVAKVAVEQRGVDTLVKFFGRELAATLKAEGRQADLVLGNNVLAQVPDLNSFVAGIRTLLKPTGTCTIEFPHLQRLVEGNQFDTIYHEHYLLLLADRGRADLRGPRHDDLRRRGAVDPRRLAAHLRAARRRTRRGPIIGARAEAARAGEGGRLPRPAALPRRSRSRCARPSASCWSC